MERLVSLFEALGQQVDDAECRGCPFQMALAELHDPAAAAHLRAAEVKHWVRGQLAGLTAEVHGIGSNAAAEALADQVMLVMEGVYASVLSTAVPGSPNPTSALVGQLLASGARAGSSTG